MNRQLAFTNKVHLSRINLIINSSHFTTHTANRLVYMIDTDFVLFEVQIKFLYII